MSNSPRTVQPIQTQYYGVDKPEQAFSGNSLFPNENVWKETNIVNPLDKTVNRRRSNSTENSSRDVIIEDNTYLNKRIIESETSSNSSTTSPNECSPRNITQTNQELDSNLDFNTSTLDTREELTLENKEQAYAAFANQIFDNPDKPIVLKDFNDLERLIQLQTENIISFANFKSRTITINSTEQTINSDESILITGLLQYLEINDCTEAYKISSDSNSASTIYKSQEPPIIVTIPNGAKVTFTINDEDNSKQDIKDQKFISFLPNETINKASTKNNRFTYGEIFFLMVIAGYFLMRYSS